MRQPPPKRPFRRASSAPPPPAAPVGVPDPDREPSRPRGRPRSVDAHAAILGAAIELIREVGYDALGMEAIAARAGVGKATVYRRWTSKELLVAEAIGQLVRTVPVPDTGAVESDVLALMRTTTAMYRDPATTALLSGLVAAMARSEHVGEAVRSGFVARWRDGMRQVLHRAMARGELRVDTDVDVALDLLSGPLFYRFLMRGVPIDERFTRTIVKTVLRALAANSAGPPTDTSTRRPARR